MQFVYVIQYRISRDQHLYLNGEMPERPKGRDWKSRVPLIAGPWVRIPLSPPDFPYKAIDSWVLRNGNLRTPSGPEGSSGSKHFRVPQGSLAINIISLRLRNNNCVVLSVSPEMATSGF